MMRLLAILVSAVGHLWLFIAAASAQQIVKFKASEPNERKPIMLRGELYKPQVDGRFPAVILMHGCGGWQPAVKYALQGYGQSLQKSGYVALNLDSFGPRYYNGEEMCASNARLLQAIEYRTADAFDAAQYLRGLDFVDGRNIFLMGQSNGGSVVLRAAQTSTQETYRRKAGGAELGIRGVVAFYPWCGLFSGRARLAVPVQIFAGGQDNWVSASECTEVHATGANYDVKVYPAAAHSFDLDIIAQKYSGFLIGGDPSAKSDSRRLMMGFLNSQLTPDLKRSARLSD